MSREKKTSEIVIDAFALALVVGAASYWVAYAAGLTEEVRSVGDAVGITDVTEPSTRTDVLTYKDVTTVTKHTAGDSLYFASVFGIAGITWLLRSALIGARDGMKSKRNN